MLDCRRCDRVLEKTDVHAFFDCPLIRHFWIHIGKLTARVDPKHLVFINHEYVCDNVSLLRSEVKRLLKNGGVGYANGVNLT